MPPRIPARKAPAKRAFSGMVGRDAPRDVKPKPASDDTLSVTSSDFHFQKEAHDRGSTFRRRDPVGTLHLNVGGGISKATQDVTGVSVGDGKNSGLRIEEYGPVCRPDTPDWVRDPAQLDDFFNKRLKVQSGYETWGMTYGLDFEKWGLTYGLDRAILVEHYLKNYTDELIFEGNKGSFQKERRLLGRERWTSSVEAVKQRRLRLESEREALYKPKKWTKNSWRGIIIVSRESTMWEIKYIAIATKSRRAAASRIVDYWGYRTKVEETAEIVADEIFDTADDLASWAETYGIASEDVVDDNFRQRN